MSDGLGSVKRVVLPSTVRVGSPENLFRPLQLLGALNQRDRRASAGVEPVPEGLVLGDLIPGELIRFIDQACISHSERPIPEIRHAIVTKSVDVIDVEPVMIHGEKIIACQLAIEVSALAEIAEVVFREGSHERIFAIPEPRVGIEVGKVDPGVPVHRINDNGDAMLMRNINESLKIGPLPKAFVYSEVTDRKIAPVYRRGHVR